MSRLTNFREKNKRTGLFIREIRVIVKLLNMSKISRLVIVKLLISKLVIVIHEVAFASNLVLMMEIGIEDCSLTLNN